MRKRGISGVVATVILIALVLAAVAIVWGVVTNLVSEQLEEAGSCFEVFDKISLDGQYTCYDSATNKFNFSIGVGNVELEEIIVLVSAEGATNSYNLNKNPTGDTEFQIPNKNSGRTFTVDLNSRPDLVQIAAIIKENRCEIADSITNIRSCSLLA